MVVRHSPTDSRGLDLLLHCGVQRFIPLPSPQALGDCPDRVSPLRDQTAEANEMASHNECSIEEGRRQPTVGNIAASNRSTGGVKTAALANTVLAF